MHGIKDRTTGTATAPEPSRKRRSVAGAAVAVVVLAGGVTAVVVGTDLGRESRDEVTTSAPGTVVPPVDQAPVDQAPVDQAPVDQVPVEAPGQAPVDEAPDPVPPQEAGSDDDADAPGDGDGAAGPAAPDGGEGVTVPAGTYDVQVLGEGWDARGRYLLVDRGRLTDGPPAEPGVDGTKPVLFDTGAAAERLRLDLAERYSLQFARAGGEPSYGSGSWADLVTAVSGRDTAMLATVEVDGEGRLVSLVEPYRP